MEMAFTSQLCFFSICDDHRNSNSPCFKKSYLNSAAMNTGVHVSLSDLVSLVCMQWENLEGAGGEGGGRGDRYGEHM